MKHNKKTQYKQYKTQQIQAHILPKHPHITKQVKTTTVQDTPKWNSHNIIKYPQHKVTLMYHNILLFLESFLVAWNLVILLEMGMPLLNLFALRISYNCHTVWRLKCWSVCIADGLSWPLLCSHHLNCGLLHITLGFNSGTKGIQCQLILISNLGRESTRNAEEWVALIFVNGLI